MKKEVTYYLEDTSRLGEISQAELDAWIEEMPFHQPLRILASIKAEMEGLNAENKNKVFSAYFAEDFESVSNRSSKKDIKKNKNTPPLTNTNDINTKGDDDADKEEVIKKTEEVVEEEVVEEIKEVISEDIANEGMEVQTEEVTEEERENINVPPTIVHELADDVKEESIEDEINENLKNIRVNGEVSSDLANATLEDGILSEMLEEEMNIDQPTEVETEIEELKSAQEAVFSETEQDIEENVDTTEHRTVEAPESIEPTTKELEATTKVDYSDFSNLAVGKSSSKSKNKKKKSKSKKKDKVELKNETSTAKKEDKKKKKKKSKKDNKSVLEVVANKKATQEDSQKQEKKKKKKVKAKSASGEKRKKKKGKKKTRVEYIIVDSTKGSDFRLNNYDGVSNYTSWLLEQESINKGKKQGSKLAENLAKNAKKKKKKKKKNKTLKIAVDSIKKQDTIISEPLANILASQGHKKKAIRMYEKLAVVFPEKKEYYADKIAALGQ